MFACCGRDVLWFRFTPEVFQIAKNDDGFALLQELRTSIEDVLSEGILEGFAYSAPVLSFGDRIFRGNKSELKPRIYVLSIDKGLEREHVVCIQTRYGARCGISQNGLSRPYRSLV